MEFRDLMTSEQFADVERVVAHFGESGPPVTVLCSRCHKRFDTISARDGGLTSHVDLTRSSPEALPARHLREGSNLWAAFHLEWWHQCRDGKWCYTNKNMLRVAEKYVIAATSDRCIYLDCVALGRLERPPARGQLAVRVKSTLVGP